MLRYLLILVCLACTANVIAQKTKEPATKTTEKQAAEIDYKELGSPMPRLKVLLYRDTSTRKDTTTKETAAKSKKSPDIVVSVNGTQANVSAAARSKKRRKKPAKEDTADSTNSAQGKYLTNDDVNNKANLFVMMFNPTCSHCEDMAALMRNNSTLFKKTKLVLMANPGMKQYLPDFVNRQHLNEYPVFNIGIDSSDFINKIYLFQMLPQINIYDRNRKLLKIYNGEVPIDSLKQYIE